MKTVSAVSFTTVNVRCWLRNSAVRKKPRNELAKFSKCINEFRSRFFLTRVFITGILHFDKFRTYKFTGLFARVTLLLVCTSQRKLPSAMEGLMTNERVQLWHLHEAPTHAYLQTLTWQRIAFTAWMKPTISILRVEKSSVFLMCSYCQTHFFFAKSLNFFYIFTPNLYITKRNQLCIVRLPIRK